MNVPSACLVAVLLSIVSACGSAAEKPAAKPTQAAAQASSGNSQVDALLASVAARDAAAIASEVGGYESLSGRPMPFSDAAGYLDRVKDCSASRVASNPQIRNTYEIEWACPEGSFRQTVNTAYHAPKLTLTELY